MNIKSLLLGSAAVLAAVSGARAADAVVVAEPEPMEYVRICDVYGAGYYYIPGTETCLKIGGYVRYEIQFDDRDDGWKKLARAELTFTAKSETEYGTLTGHIDLRGDVKSGFNGDVWDPQPNNYDYGGAYFRVQHAWISLAGLQMGMSDTLYDGDLSGEFDGGGGDRLHFVRYNWVGGNGVSASLSIEEEDWNRNYIPNVVGKVGIEQGWGSINVFAAYDDDDDFLARDDEFALKAIATFKATEQLTIEALASYESGPSFYSIGTPAGYGGYEWTVAGYLKFAATDRLTVGAGGQYFAGRHFDDNDDWAVGAVVDYKIVENFDAKLAINYEDGDSYDGVLARAGAAEATDGVFSGFLRFTRSF